MKQTKGFVTDDGTFFEEELEAKLYEAEMALRSALSLRFPQLPQEKFFAVVIAVFNEMKEYIHAHDAYFPRSEPQADPSEIGAEVEDSDSPAPNVSPTHITGKEEDLASILKLPNRRSVEGHTGVDGTVSSEQQ